MSFQRAIAKMRTRGENAMPRCSILYTILCIYTIQVIYIQLFIYVYEDKREIAMDAYMYCLLWGNPKNHHGLW
jgi:hypothetical protein